MWSLTLPSMGPTSRAEKFCSSARKDFLDSIGQKRTSGIELSMSASLIGRLGSSAFRLSTTAVSMSLAGSCFSSESAPGPFHHGIRGRGGTTFWAALPAVARQVQADMRTHLIHRPARDIFHRPVELEFSPIGFDPDGFSCCCRGLFSGPAELGAVNP